MRRASLVVVSALAALAFVYFKAIHPWTMRWGATDEEAGRSLRMIASRLAAIRETSRSVIGSPFLERTRCVLDVRQF